MVYVNEQGYLERSTRAGRRNSNSKGTKRNWWFVVHNHDCDTGKVTITNGISISMPPKYIGKRVRFKIEVVK